MLDDDGVARLLRAARRLVHPRSADRAGLLGGELASEEVLVAPAAQQPQAAAPGERRHEAERDLDEEAGETAADGHVPLHLEGQRTQGVGGRGAGVREPWWCQHDTPAAQPDDQEETEREKGVAGDPGGH